jgi:hypothetical protein
MKAIYTRAAQGLLALSASALLVACGGGGGGGAPSPQLVPGTDVPLAATESSQAAVDFVATVVAKGEANTETPLTVGDAVLATSEVAEPASFAI